MNLSEAAKRVIELGRKVRAYYETELPKRYPHYPLMDPDKDPDEESVPPPPEERQLQDFLATLSEDMIYQLILLMYLGRGDFSGNDLAGYYAARKGTVGDAEQAADWIMMYKTTLADQIEDGLEELRKHRISVDKLPLKRVKARKQ
jgi:hypothetical protein